MDNLGFLFESQKVSMRRIKEFANIEKLESDGNYVAGDHSSNTQRSSTPRGEKDAGRSYCRQRQ